MERTRGQVEAEISKALVKFERDYMGRGPEDIRTFILRDMVLIRLRGILTPAERQLVKVEGVELIKQVRAKLLEGGRDLVCKTIRDLTGAEVVSLHSDLSTKTGERVILLCMDRDIEAAFPGD